MVEAELTTVTTQPHVKQAMKVEETGDDGSIIGFSVAPRYELYSRIVLHGDRLRHEHYEDRAAAPTQILVLRDGEWTKFIPGSGVAWVKRPEDMEGSFMHVDPLQFGVPNIQRNMSTILREDAVLSADLIDAQQPGCRIKTQDSRGTQLMFQFGSQFNFLPTSTAELYPDGTFMRFTAVSYQPLGSGAATAWFLKRAVSQWFEPGRTSTLEEALKLIEDTSERVTTTVDVTKVVSLDPAESDTAFIARIPDGVRVVDTVQKKIFYQGGVKPKRPEIERRTGRFWSLIALDLVVLALVAGGLYFRKRWTKSHI